MKAIVTGVGGFIGSRLARRLLAEGYEVLGIDSLTDYYDIRIKRHNLHGIKGAKFNFLHADLNHIDVNQVLDGVDYVFHQAGQPGVRSSWGDDFALYQSANIQATQRLLEAAKTSGSLQKLVYASSSSIYGDAAEYPTEETATPKPLSPYGVTKLAAEHLCTLYASNFAVPTVSLRYFTVYGPGQRPDMAFTRFIRASVLDEEIELYGTGEQIRDFTYVDDVVEANLLAATQQTVPGAVFNVAGGSNISVNAVLGILGELRGQPLRVRRERAVPGDVFRTGGSTERIREHLGWAPTVSIQDGLARHLAWGKETFATMRDKSQQEMAFRVEVSGHA